MNEHKQDYIHYRLAKAKETLSDARLLAENDRWNASVNRLYYACYHAVSALLLKHGISAKTHAGVKLQFGQHFIKTGKISRDAGKLFIDLMDWRHKGDYNDMFDFDKETVEPLLIPVEKFLDSIEALMQE